MFSSNQIVFEPDYDPILKKIISEYSSMSDYDNDDNDFYNNLNIIFYTKTKPDSIHSTIKSNDKYFMSMSVKELRRIIKICYDATEFTNELLVSLVRYLPMNLFAGMETFLPFKGNVNISIEKPKFIPNNRDKVIILDNLPSMNSFIKKFKSELHNYELRKLVHLTLRLNDTKSTMERICSLTEDNEYSKFLLKENGDIVFDNMLLNSNLSTINNERRERTKVLYRSTKNEIFLSNDVLYKFIITRSIEDWCVIFKHIKVFEDSGIFNVLKSYRHIYDLFV